MRLICTLTDCSEELTISIMMGQRISREARGVSTRVKKEKRYWGRHAAEGGTSWGLRE